MSSNKSCLRMALLEFLIPTYKRPRECLRAATSILSQCTSREKSLINISIRDDATPDLDLGELTLSISTINPGIFVTITQNSSNLGMSANIYQMVQQVNAQYWTVLTDDDMIKHGMLKHLLKIVQSAATRNIGSIVSTRECYHENGDLFYKACNPLKTYPSIISCTPFNALRYMKNGHILTGLILSSNSDMLQWKKHISNAYFPVIAYGISMLGAECLYVDSGCFKHTVGNLTHWERWGSDVESQNVRLFSDLWAAHYVVFTKALENKGFISRIPLYACFYLVRYDILLRCVRNPGFAITRNRLLATVSNNLTASIFYQSLLCLAMLWTCLTFVTSSLLKPLRQ